MTTVSWLVGWRECYLGWTKKTSLTVCLMASMMKWLSVCQTNDIDECKWCLCQIIVFLLCYSLSSYTCCPWWTRITSRSAKNQIWWMNGWPQWIEKYCSPSGDIWVYKNKTMNWQTTIAITVSIRFCSFCSFSIRKRCDHQSIPCYWGVYSSMGAWVYLVSVYTDTCSQNFSLSVSGR
jgi:hypothetical protein